MKQGLPGILTLAGVALAVGCADGTTPSSNLTGPRFAVEGERTGSVKTPSEGMSIAAATIAVSDIFGGGVTATSIAQSLAGAGVTIQNVAYTGDSKSAGTFTNGSGLIGFDKGTILTSGWAEDALGPNLAGDISRNLGGAGDAILTALSGYPTNDATVLSFEIVPDADKVYFEYVFASEEYNEWVFTQYNDVFAFQINGQNCAVVGSPPAPVSINTINNGHNYDGVGAQNPDMYINNPIGGALNIEPDGLTTVLVCAADVNKNVPNTVRLAIADASDNIYDSWVFIKEGSFSTTPPSNQRPTLDPISDKTVNEGSSLSFAVVASDPDAGQTLTYSLIGGPAGASLDPNSGVFSWTPADDDPTGTPADAYSAIVRVTDNGSPALSADQPVTITVMNVAPTIDPFTTYPTGPVAVGTAVSLSAPFSDPGSGDTFTGSVDWGDGASAADIVPFVSISGSHTYSTPGVYPVTMSLADDDGGTASAQFQYVVVYDPNGGFVTGGGWINSPAGAYAADPALSGRATFGFVSKYAKGATVPDGETQFQFHTGHLNFHSTVYEWLVISGPKAQYKGSGTINGAGDYGFLLTANDGQALGGGGVDRFRIKIWDKATNAVIYDNQSGDSDTDPAATALGGGSIVIHK